MDAERYRLVYHNGEVVDALVLDIVRKDDGDYLVQEDGYSRKLIAVGLLSSYTTSEETRTVHGRFLEQTAVMEPEDWQAAREAYNAKFPLGVPSDAPNAAPSRYVEAEVQTGPPEQGRRRSTAAAQLNRSVTTA